MLLIRISLDILGDNFSPNMLLTKLNINTSFITFTSNEPTDFLTKDKNDQYGFGSISILHPNKVGVEDNLSEYEEWYVEFLETNYKFFIDSGANEVNLLYETFYNKQCNFEIFNKELLKKITVYNVSIPICVYMLTNSQIREILCDANYNKDYVKQIMKGG